MTQIRPRIDANLAAEVRAYGDRLPGHLSFESAVEILLTLGLRTAQQNPAALNAIFAAAPIKGDDSDELRPYQRGPVRAGVRAGVACR